MPHRAGIPSGRGRNRCHSRLSEKIGRYGGGQGERARSAEKFTPICRAHGLRPSRAAVSSRPHPARGEGRPQVAGARRSTPAVSRRSTDRPAV
jgi:hypothetical protein